MLLTLQWAWWGFEPSCVNGLQVELKTNPDTPDSGSVQKAADFVQAFILGMSCCILLVSNVSAGGCFPAL